MYVAKTPCRISLFGGGTDYEEFIEKSGESNILSFTIDKFVYSLVKSNYDNSIIYKEKYRLSYYKSEINSNINNIKNKIIKAILKKYDMNNSYYISLFSDIASGSGLGSSSAFIVNLIRIFNLIKNKKQTDEEIFKLALKIERKSINLFCGYQDQASASFGGFNHFVFSNNKLTVNNMSHKQDNLNKMIKNSFLIWTNRTRDSSHLLKEQKKNIKNRYSFFNNVNNLCKDAIKILNNKKFDINIFGKLLIESYQEKKNYSKFIADKNIIKIEEEIKKFNPIGYKLLGAGGGGFVLCIMDKSNKVKFFDKNKKKLDFKILDFNFYNKNSNVVKLI